MHISEGRGFGLFLLFTVVMLFLLAFLAGTVMPFLEQAGIVPDKEGAFPVVYMAFLAVYFSITLLIDARGKKIWAWVKTTFLKVRFWRFRDIWK